MHNLCVWCGIWSLIGLSATRLRQTLNTRRYGPKITGDQCRTMRLIDYKCLSLIERETPYSIVYSLHIVKEVLSDINTVSKNNFWPLTFYYKKFIKYSQHILLRNYISRWIYLYRFYIFKLWREQFCIFINKWIILTFCKL